MKNLTTHAEKRINQRSIPKLMLNMLDIYADEEYQKNGTYVLRLSRSGKNKLKKDLKALLAHFDSLQNCYLVEDSKGNVITAAHTYKH